MKSVYKSVIWWRRSSVHQNQRSKSHKCTPKPRLAACAKGKKGGIWGVHGAGSQRSCTQSRTHRGSWATHRTRSSEAGGEECGVLQFMGKVGPFRWFIYNPRFLQRAWGTSGDGHLGTGVFYRTSTKEVPKFVT